MANKSVDFGKWLSGLALQADAATGETLKGLQEKMKKEKQEALERRLRSVFSRMEDQVVRLRSLRRQEDAIKSEIKKLEEQANNIVAGRED